MESTGAETSGSSISYRDMNGAEGQLQDSDVVLIIEDEVKQSYAVVCGHDATSEPDSLPNVEILTIPTSSQLPPTFVDKHRLHKLPPQLSLPPEDLYVIISTKSGTGKAEAYFQDVLRPVLDAIGIKNDSGYKLIKTESEHSIKEFTARVLVEKAERGVKQTVLLLSGDGGVADMSNAILAHGSRSSDFIRPTIALFPLGTGNATYYSMHRDPEASPGTPLPSDTTTALHSLLHGTPHPLPSFSTTFSLGAVILSNEGRTATPITSSSPNSNQLFGAVVASYGFHATLVADSDTAEYRKHGAKRFHMVAQELLHPSDGGEPHAYKAKVTFRRAGGTETVLPRTEYGYILATMASNLEKMFVISPSSRPLEGKLRVVHFGPESGDEVMRIMGEAYQNGKHITDPKGVVGYDEVESMRIDFLEEGEDDGRWRRACVDGLIVRVEEGGWMEVRKVRDEAVDMLL